MHFLFLAFIFFGTPNDSDKAICGSVFSFAFEHTLMGKPVGDVMTEMGKKFIDSPYIAGTLEEPGEEHLVVNLRGFDCVTLVENSLALARCVKGNRMSFDAYTNELDSIRYRHGKIAGYASRLNYFSEWIHDNAEKNILHDVTRELGGVPYKKPINFMTAHRDKYPKLAPDSVFHALEQIEKNIAADTFYYIPKKSIAAIESKIQSGDIIAVTTDIAGLDISHTAIAIRMEDGSLRLLHAPDVGERVTITKDALSKYLERHAHQMGIIVARPQ